MSIRLKGNARTLALEMFAEARSEWGFATDVMARGFRTHRELSSGDRRLVSETVYGLIRMHRRIEAIVDQLLERAPERQLSPRMRDELGLLVFELRGGAAPLEAVNADARRLGLPLALDPAAAEDAGIGDREGLARDAMRLSFPDWVMERFAADHGPETAVAMAEAMNQRAPMTVRTNTVRISRELLIARLAEEGVTAVPTPLSPTGLVLQTRVNAFGLHAFRDGLFEVMDEGSQLIAEAVAPPPGGKVVDACAGAGGKTLALAAGLGNRGRLLGLDVDGRKLEELRRRARRAGVTNAAARQIREGEPLPAEARPGFWDRVLVDAPCSGLGALRRNPEARWRLTPAAVDSFPPRQLALLIEYAPLVAVGGRLVYATCTVTRAENDEVVERFLAERAGEFIRMPLKEIWGKERALALGDGDVLRLLPHRHDTDGFFATVLRRIR